jgi:hypothetical protein
MTAGEAQTTEPHEDRVPGIVTKFVRRRKKDERDSEITEEVPPAVDPASPAEAQGRKEKRKHDHAKLESLARKKTQTHEGQNREANGQYKTMKGTRERNNRTYPIHVVEDV